MEHDKKQQHSSAEPHNQHTRPADNPDKDKLRENPHNDERTIDQKDGSDADLRAGSTFARKEEGQNRVTNQEEQQQVVNPSPAGADNLAAGSAKSSDNPYEDLNNDSEEIRKKIPKM